MTSAPDNLYVTYVGVDRDLLKIWGQRNRIGATYIERQLLQMLPQFNRSSSPNPAQIQKGMFCFAKYRDDNYYRARVISRVQGDSVGVLFVDYGNRDIIKLSNIRIQQGSEGEVLAKMSEQAEEYYLAGIAAPPTGWTKEVVSKIRSDICYEEFFYQILAAVGDQKILKIQFRNEDYSNYLVKKQLASPLSLPDQRQMILAYCSLVSCEGKPEGAISGLPGQTFTPSVRSNMRGSFRPSNANSEEMMPLNFEKKNNVVDFSQPPPPLQYSSQRHVTNAFQEINSNIQKNACFPSLNQLNNQTPVNVNPSQPINSLFNPLMNHQFNPLYMVKDSGHPFSSNTNIIQLLAQQVKQYIAEESNTNSESQTVDIPHHYVNSVLEVGNTYNVIVSYIDDGPWSFSIQLLSSETELQKLMDELSSTELVPIKPPIILGHSCIASSALYGNLCRGVVVSISHTAVKVYFVDFGNTEDLPSSSIYELPQKFFKIRVLSQKFSLSGLQKVVYSEDIKKFFKEVVQDELLMLRVTSLEDDNLPTCELYLKDKNIKRILNEKIRELRSATAEDFPKVGDVESVVVTWVVSPQKFFVQLHRRDAELKALKDELAEVDRKGERLTYQQLSVGFRCVCQYESDGNWYRTVITSVDSENAITVFYIDYGNTETVKISLLRRMDSSLLIKQMSSQAIQCSLAGFENKPFEPEIARKFESLVLEKDFQMGIVSSEKELLSVQLMDNGQDISSMLNVLPPKVDSLEVPPPNRTDVWNSASVDTRFTNTYEKEKKVPEKIGSFDVKENKSFVGDTTRSEGSQTWRSDKDRNEQKSENQNSFHHRSSKPKRDGDGRNIPASSKFGGKKGRDDRIESAKFERSRGSKQDKTRDAWNNKKDSINFGEKKKFSEDEKGKFNEKKFNTGEGRRLHKSRGGDDSRKKFDRNKTFPGSETFKSSRKPIRKEDVAPPGSKFQERVLELGSSELGIVTYYFSPHEFYVQLLAQEQDFKSMMKDIQIYYNDKYSLRDPVQAGDIVIAQFSLDKVLYRAEVVKPSPVTVRYVDYGNHEPVGQKETWLVDKKFLKLPKQVVKCRLPNILPIGSDWPPPGGAIDKFFELGEYKFTFLNFDGDMYDVSMEFAENGKDIAREIIAAGLVRPAVAKLVAEVDYSLLPNQVLRLYVSHIESSSKFYVIINPKGLEVIKNELEKFTADEKNLIRINESDVKLEMPCLSTQDGVSWHRGNIIKTDGNEITVWFCDRGESAVLTPDKLMHLPDHLKVLQPQAVHCTLHGVSSLAEEDFKNEIEHKYHLVSIASVDCDRLSVVLYNENGEKFNWQKCDEFPSSIEPISQLPIISQEVPVLISHVETPKEVHIRNVADRDELENLSQSMSSFYSGEREGLDVEENETAGRLVAAKSITYCTWCRGRLVRVADEGLEVFYIDYGDKEILPRENVKKLAPSFWSLNSLSRKVDLDVEFNADKTEEIKKCLKCWVNKELLGHFKKSNANLMFDFVLNGKKVAELLKPECFAAERGEGRNVEKDTSADKTAESCSKVFVRHIDSPKMFWVQKETTVNDLHELQDKLQKSCERLPGVENVQAGDVVATVFCDVWYRAKVLKVEGFNVTVQFIDYGNTVVLNSNSSSIKKLTEELVNVPPFATPLALKGSWSDNFTTKFEEIILQDEDPVSVVVLEESDPVVVDLLQNGVSVTEMLTQEEVFGGEEAHEDGDLCTVYITHSNSPCDFYVQRESCTDLFNKLTDRYSDTSGFCYPSSIEENDMCVAKFPEDGAWYRARICKKDGDEIQVHFIDYGNTSTVTEIKCLPQDLKHIPSLAENCCLLYGRNSDDWSESACEQFAEYADGRELKMRVVAKKNGKSVVELFDGSKNINEELEALCENDGRSEVYVTHVVSPTHFYVRWADDEGYKTVAEALENPGECEDLKERTPGALCLARSTDDGCWYRAKVLRNLDEGCEVFFVDFGDVSVSREVKSLPAKLEGVPPRALRCSLSLPENLPEAVKEKFSSIVGGATVFRARIIVPGDVNVVSLKLNGRIIEETLDVVPEESIVRYDSAESETDDGKNSKKILMSENYLAGKSGEGVRNETDEEKRVKIAISGVEGCKSDDEKESEGGKLPSGYVNATDNELMEDALEDCEGGENASEADTGGLETVEEVSEEMEESEESNNKTDTVAQSETGKEQNGVSPDDAMTIPNGVEKSQNGDVEFVNSPKKFIRNKAQKIVPGCISLGEEENEDNRGFPPPYLKKNFSEKLVPGSICRGVSLESVTCEGEHLEEPPKARVSQSAPNTPKLTRRIHQDYVKTDPNDRVVPGCISAGILLHCTPPTMEKIPQADKIVSGAVNSSFGDS